MLWNVTREDCIILLRQYLLNLSGCEDTKLTWEVVLTSGLGPLADYCPRFLWQHAPPSVISDLFTDIKKGHVLLDLLEVLSGQQLVRFPITTRHLVGFVFLKKKCTSCF